MLRELDELLDKRVEFEDARLSKPTIELLANALGRGHDGTTAIELYMKFVELLSRAMGDKIKIAANFRSSGDDATKRRSLALQLKLLREIFMRPQGLFALGGNGGDSDPDEVTDALIALNHGEVMPLFKPVKLKGTSANRFTRALHKRRALCWRAFLSERAGRKKRASIDVADAFGVTTEALRTWNGQCTTIFGSWEIENRLQQASTDAAAERPNLSWRRPLIPPFNALLELSAPVEQALASDGRAFQKLQKRQNRTPKK